MIQMSIDTTRRNGISSIPDVIDPLDAKFINDPYPVYSSLRRSRPIVPLLTGGHLLARHKDISDVLGNPHFGNAPSRFSTLHSGNREKYTAADVAANILPFLDPPQHTAPRQIIATVFRQRFRSFTGDINGIAERQFAMARQQGATEVIREIAEPFSLNVMCRFLGLPEPDGPLLKDFAESFFYLFAPINDPNMFKHVNEQLEKFRNYFDKQIQIRKTNPQDDFINDLMSADNNGHTLTDKQVSDTCILLFADGIQNVQYGIANILIQLGDKPAYLDEVARSPVAENPVISEALRLESPAQLIPRIVLEDTVLHDTELRSGSPVFLALASANRDESIFEEPDSFMLERDRSMILTFGSGRHACIGGALALLQCSALISSMSQSGCSIKTNRHDVKYIPRFGHRWPEAVTISY